MPIGDAGVRGQQAEIIRQLLLKQCRKGESCHAPGLDGGAWGRVSLDGHHVRPANGLSEPASPSDPRVATADLESR